MPYRIDYIQEDEGIIIRWNGSVSAEEVVQSYHDRYAPLERFSTLRYVIIDYTDAVEMELNPEVIRTIAEISNRAAPYNRGLRAVAIMTTEFGFGMARMFQAYADDDTTGWHTVIARSRDEAARWLRENLDPNLVLSEDYDIL